MITNHCRTLRELLAVAAVTLYSSGMSAWAQPSPYGMDMTPPSREVIQVASESEIVVVGTVVAQGSVSKPEPEKLRRRLEEIRRNRGGEVFLPSKTGFLSTVRIDRVLFRGSDWKSLGPGAPILSSEVRIFVAIPLQANREYLRKNGRHILFLSQHPNQEELRRIHGLSPEFEYLQTTRRELGIFALDDKVDGISHEKVSRPLLERLTRLSEAMNAPTREIKVTRLMPLQHSGDDRLDEMATALIEILDSKGLKDRPIR